jgi:hypothetical protein
MLLLTPLASAAVLTEVPPFLRGDVTVAYSYDRLAGVLTEEGEDGNVEVGDRALSEHMLRYNVTFGVAPGAAVFVEIPHYVSSTVSYSALSEMVYDASTGSGTYVSTNAGTPGTYVQGSGLGGIWIGVKGTPFSEAFPKRNSRATWLLEGAFRTADSSNYWVVNDEGKRGAGPGGTAFRLNTVFSTTFGNSAPYIQGTYQGEGKRTQVVTDGDGNTGTEEVELDPANFGKLVAGVEVLAGRNPASGSILVFDLHLNVAYAGYAYVPSGIYLPNVLAASAGEPVLQSEQFEPGAGLAVHWRPFENLEIGLNGDAAYHLPQRIEYPYPVYTANDTLRLDLGASVKVRFR